jgi:hypothetical protein
VALSLECLGAATLFFCISALIIKISVGA